MDFTTWTTGERFLADGAQFQRRTDAEVDRKAVLLVDTNVTHLVLVFRSKKTPHSNVRRFSFIYI